MMSQSPRRWATVLSLAGLLVGAGVLFVLGATSPTVSFVSPTGSTMQSTTSVNVNWQVTDDGHDSVARDTFSGTNNNSWGSATQGGSWKYCTYSTSNACNTYTNGHNYKTGGIGYATSISSNQYRLSSLDSLGTRNMVTTARFRVDAISGGTTYVGLANRVYKQTSNLPSYYMGFLAIPAGGSNPTLEIRRRQCDTSCGGVVTMASDVVPANISSVQANTWYWIKFASQGGSGNNATITHRLKVWRHGDPEPTAWDYDNTFSANPHPNLRQDNSGAGIVINTYSSSQTVSVDDFDMWEASNSSDLSYSLQRQRAGASNGSCGSYTNDGSAISGPGPVNQTGLSSGFCYRWVVTATNDYTGLSGQATSGSVLIDTSPPGAFTITNNSGSVASAYASSTTATTIWFRPSGAQTLTLTSNANDAESGISGHAWSPSSATGWTLQSTTGSSRTYTYSSSAGNLNASVSATNGAGLSTSGPTISLTADSAAPVRSFSSPSSGTSYHTSTSYTVTFSATDSGSGITSGGAGSWSLQRQRATLSNNSCGSFSNDASPVTGSAAVTDQNSSQTLSSGFCYQWVLTATDNVGNSGATTSGIVRVDTSAPTTPTISNDASSVASAYATSASATTIWFRPAGAGTVTLTATSSDPETSVASRSWSPANQSGWTLQSTTGSSRTYTYSSSSGTLDTSVSATNNAGLTSGPSSTVTFSPDSTAPSRSFSNPPSGTTFLDDTGFAVGFSATDSGAGITSDTSVSGWTLQRQKADAADGACGTFSNDGSPVTGSAGGSSLSSNQTLADGFCYRWELSARDNVDNAATVLTSGTVLVDTALPTVDFAAPDEGADLSQPDTTYTVSWSEGASSSGIAARSLQRQSAPIADPASCEGVDWSDDGEPVGAPSPVEETELVSGYCYRWIQTLTNAAGADGSSVSGTLRIASAAPTADFSAPASDTLTIQNATTSSVEWSEDGQGHAIVSRSLQRQRAAIAVPGSCAGLDWNDDGAPMSDPSPVLVDGLSDGYCYRWQVALSSSAGGQGGATSGAMLVDTSLPEVDFEAPDEASTTIQAATSYGVSWTEDGTGSLIVTRSLQRQRAEVTEPGSCEGLVFTDDGAASDATSPVLAENLASGHCYRWQVTLTDEAGNTGGGTSGGVIIDDTAPTIDFIAPDEGTTVVQSANSYEVSWLEDVGHLAIAGRSLQRQQAETGTPGSCDELLWHDDGQPSTSASPVVEEGLLEEHCYRWWLTLTNELGTQTVQASGSLYVSGPPQVELVQPLDGWVLFSAETLSASIVGSADVETVEFLLDDVVIASLTEEPWAFEWDTTTVADEPYELLARATLADQSVLLSPAISVTVANALSADNRLDADFDAGRIDVDFYAVNGVYALGAPHVLPSRYESINPSLAGTGGISRYLGVWDTLSAASLDEIQAFLAQPLRGSYYGAVPAPDQPAVPAKASADSCQFVKDEYPTFMDGVTHYTTAFHCIHDVRMQPGDPNDPVLARILYTIDGTQWTNSATGAELGDSKFSLDSLSDPRDQDLNANGTPDYIDSIDKAVRDAHPAYFDDGEGQLSYERRWNDIIHIMVGNFGSQVMPLSRSPQPTLDVPTVQLWKAEQFVEYTLHHELFHVLQYQYLDERALRNNVVFDDGPWWWMEASAQWAAAYVSSTVPGAGDRGRYAVTLPDFLGRPEEAITELDKTWANMLGLEEPPGNRPYGAFIFVEFLAGRLRTDELGNAEYDPGVVKDIWEQIEADLECDLFTCRQNVLKSLEEVVDAEERSLTEVMTDFWRANYLLDYDYGIGGSPSGLGSTHLEDFWRARLQDRPETKDDEWGPPRPKRLPVELQMGQPASDQATVWRGGATYVDLIPPAPGVGQLMVEVTAGFFVHAALLVVGACDPASSTPSICHQDTATVGAGGAVALSTLVGPGEYAVLMVSYYHLGQPDKVDLSWEAVFEQLPGMTWTAHPDDPDPFTGRSNFRWSAFGNGLWLAGGNPGESWYATDPAGTWQQSASESVFGSTGHRHSAFYGDGVWVMVGHHRVGIGPTAPRIATSSDGIHWTANSFNSFEPVDVSYGNGLWVAVGPGGLATATDPTGMWTVRDAGFGTSQPRGAMWGNGLWVARGTSNTWAKSTDGINWTQQPAWDKPGGLVDIQYGNGTWVFVGGIAGNPPITASIWASEDASTWTKKADFSCVGGNIGRPVFGGGLWVLWADLAGDCAYTLNASTDLSRWVATYADNGSTGQARALGYDGDGTWVHAGQDPYILYSR
jgi:hypothetical protein